MDGQFERKMSEFRRKMKTADTPEQYIELLKEIRTFSEGAIASETNPLKQTIGMLFTFMLHSFEGLVVVANNTQKRLEAIERRLKKIEEEMNFREENR